MAAPNSTTPTPTLDAARVAELNDLLQLDHDAVQAYALAIRALTNIGRRETLIRFRGDHERHISELTTVIRRYGGMPIELPHLPTGPLKLAMQKAGTLGGDRAILLAFKTNERQSRDKYASAAEGVGALPADVQEIVRRAADDEARHYEWAEEQLVTLGAGPDSRVGRAASVVERVHAGASEGVERVARQGMRGIEAARRGASRGARAVRSSASRGIDSARRGASTVVEHLPDRPSNRQLGIAIAAAGVGFVVAAMLGGSRKGKRRG